MLRVARTPSNPHPLDLIKAHLIGSPIVELRRTRGTMVRHGRGCLERAAVLEIGGYPGSAEGVVADLGLDSRAARHLLAEQR